MPGMFPTTSPRPPLACRILGHRWGDDRRPDPARGCGLHLCTRPGCPAADRYGLPDRPLSRRILECVVAIGLGVAIALLFGCAKPTPRVTCYEGYEVPARTVRVWQPLATADGGAWRYHRRQAEFVCTQWRRD